VKVSERWLAGWVDPPVTGDPLVEQLTMQGLEVDDVTPVAAGLAGVVVGHVVEVGPHPQADRLRVCRVDAGGEVFQIVCGAPNVRAGGRYPLATIGAVLPDGTRIRPAKLRGVESVGMLCSARELGLGEDSAGLLDLGDAAVPGSDVAALLELPDRILDINLTPNRADCFSVAGLARDVAAVARATVRPPPMPAVPPGSAETAAARVEAPADCPRFALRVIAGLNAGARSPVWLVERLRRSGIRAIHPVVDVTNYVLLELGQPMHGYDRRTLAGGLVVRRARAGERLVVLGGRALELAPDVLVIADDHGPVAMAGIIGGEASGVGAATQDVVLESAAFAPATIAGRARRYGLQTDASMRFERGVDPGLQVTALERATALLVAIAGGTPGPITVVGAELPPRGAIRLRRARLRAVLGAEVADADVGDILTRLGLAPAATADGWDAHPPAFRFDLEREVDLVEEVARVHGYARIAAVAEAAQLRPGRATEDRVTVPALRRRLAARGYREAITYSFTDADLDRRLTGSQGPRLRNPISADLAVLRGSTWPGLLQVLSHNRARQQDRVRLFEVGRRYRPGAEGLAEDAVCGGLAWGPDWPEQWGRASPPAVDFFDIKSDVVAALAGVGELGFDTAEHPALHPGQSARVHRAGLPIGWLGVLHPLLVRELDLVQAPVLFEFDLELALAGRAENFLAISRFPAVRRDLAVLVPVAVTAAELVAAVRGAAGAALQDVRVFDVYAGSQVEAGRKSIALGLILQESSRTLTDADVDQILDGVVQRLHRDCAASIRE
jgi:phenylalanyl-tRNA synthetase beta chain